MRISPTPGQKDQHAARLLAQGPADRFRHIPFQRPVGARAGGRIARLDRPCAPLAAPRREQARKDSVQAGPGSGRRVQRRGHDQNPQRFPQAFLTIQREGQPEESACRLRSWNSSKMRHPTPLSFGIVLQHAGEDALRDDDNARRGSDAAVEAHPVADGPPHVFPQKRSHVAGGVARGHAPGLKHDDGTARQPFRLKEGERDAGRLARAGRRFEDAAGRGRQRGQQFRKLGINGKRGHEGAHLFHTMNPRWRKADADAFRGHLFFEDALRLSYRLTARRNESVLSARRLPQTSISGERYVSYGSARTQPCL